MQPSPARQPQPVPSVEGESSTSIRRILGGLAADPYNQIFRRWNWKSAVMSAIIRAIIFFSTNIVAGLHAALAAVAADVAYRLATAGFYGTVTQALRRAEPAWHGALATMLILPLLNHSLEFLLHWARGTPKLKNSIIVSVCFTAVSTLFNWYAMRRGALLVSGEGDSLARDMARMPSILAGFLSAGPRALWRAAKRSQ
ncbi:MAG: hypothetical protein ABI693_06075 [Bryobacteraceae bacterium]